MSALNEIFFTGSTGIAGGYAAQELNQRGLPLKLLVRSVPSKPVCGALSYVQGELSELDLLGQLSQNNGGIVHYACASLHGKASPQIDIDAMAILLKNWEQGSFVYISSVDVYGFQQENKMIDESHPLSGEMNAYATGKIACEALLIEEATRRGRADFTIFRPPWIFAPNAKSKQHITNRFVKKFETEILLPGSTIEEYEKYIDCWIDARDLAWLVAKSVGKPLSGAGNVIGGKFCWHDFFMSLQQIGFSNKPIKHLSRDKVGEYAAELFGQYCNFSGSKVAQYYGFNPRYQLRETLQSAFLSD